MLTYFAPYNYFCNTTAGTVPLKFYVKRKKGRNKVFAAMLTSDDHIKLDAESRRMQ